VIIGELYLDRLYNLPLRKPAAREISRFQPVRRDFSLVWMRAFPGEDRSRAAELRIPELADWRVREVFHDAKLGKGEYSLLMGATSRRRTALAREELQSFQAQVVEAVGKAGRGSEPERRFLSIGAILTRIRCIAWRFFPMSETFWEPEVEEQTHLDNRNEVQPEPQLPAPSAEPAALTMSVDDFAGLEERILRAVEVVKRERQARAAAEERATDAESKLREQAPRIERLERNCTH